MTLEKSIAIAATREAVFEALTLPTEIVRHFPFDEVTSDDEEGGEIVFRGTASGEAFTDHGRIIRLRSGKEFTYRYWSSNHGTERAPENELEISYTLSAEAEKTKLNVVHDRIASKAYFDVMDTAWDQILCQLKQSLEAISSSANETR